MGLQSLERLPTPAQRSVASLGLRAAGAILEEGAMRSSLRYTQILRPSVASLDRVTAGSGMPTAFDPGTVAAWKRGPGIWLPHGGACEGVGRGDRQAPAL
eukprot:7756399-Pyramimonas_sp.AAC.1